MTQNGRRLGGLSACGSKSRRPESSRESGGPAATGERRGVCASRTPNLLPGEPVFPPLPGTRCTRGSHGRESGEAASCGPPCAGAGPSCPSCSYLAPPWPPASEAQAPRRGALRFTPYHPGPPRSVRGRQRRGHVTRGPQITPPRPPARHLYLHPIQRLASRPARRSSSSLTKRECRRRVPQLQKGPLASATASRLRWGPGVASFCLPQSSASSAAMLPGGSRLAFCP